MIVVPDWLQSWLLTKPEYGMGYQKVRVALSTGGRETGIVVNAQVFLKEFEQPWQMLMSDWNYILTEARNSALSISNLDVIPRPAESLHGVRQVVLAANSNFSSNAQKEAVQAKAAAAPAKDAPVTLTSAGEIFKRFSAYANDRRVTAKMGLVAGTYATTKEDADANIKTGKDAVRRYALENKKPASNVFTITPPEDTELQRGIVEPAYGEPGGGVEVIFVNGSPDYTVTGPVKIPDE